MAEQGQVGRIGVQVLLRAKEKRRNNVKKLWSSEETRHRDTQAKPKLASLSIYKKPFQNVFKIRKSQRLKRMLNYGDCFAKTKRKQLTEKKKQKNVNIGKNSIIVFKK